MEILLYIFLGSLIVIALTVIRRYIRFHFDDFLKLKKSKRSISIGEKYINKKTQKISTRDKDNNSSSKLEQLARQAVKNSNYSKAEEYYILALEKANSANIPVFLNHLSILYKKQSNHSKNIECLKKLEKLTTLTGKNCFSLGMSYLSEGKIEDAKKYLQEACLIEPNNEKYLQNLGEIYIINNEINNLEEFLNKLYEDSKEPTILFCLASIYEKTSNMKELKKIYKFIEENYKSDKKIIEKLKHCL